MRPSSSASGVDPRCTCCCCLSELGVRERRQDICGYVYAHLGLGLSCAFIRMHGDFSSLSLSASHHQVAKPPLQKQKQGIERADTDLNSSLPMNSKQERGHKWGGRDRIHHRQLSDASSARSVACPWYACFCGLSDGRVLRLSFTSRVRVAFFSLSSGVLGVSVTVHDVELDKSER